MEIQLKDRAAGPVYLQVRDEIAARIKEGAVKSGDTLPAPGVLAKKISTAEAAVDKGEVKRAYYELEHAGLISKTVSKDFLGQEKETYTVK